MVFFGCERGFWGCGLQTPRPSRLPCSQQAHCELNKFANEMVCFLVQMLIFFLKLNLTGLGEKPSTR